MKVSKNKILIIIMLLLTFCFIGCSEKELSDENDLGVKATNDEIEELLNNIILDSSYKRLTRGLELPPTAQGKYEIKWDMSDCDNAYIQTIGGASYIRISRDDEEFIRFELYATIESENGEDYGVRTWVCYIAPNKYR